MSERATLRPARAGLIVPDPDHGGLPLPSTGRELVLSSYWRRRLADGDVVVVTPPAERPTEHRPTLRGDKPAKS